MKRNKKAGPGRATQGKSDEATMTQPSMLPLYDTTTEPESQTLTLGTALRVRDAMIALERRLLEVRIAFEAEIAGILARGNGDG